MRISLGKKVALAIMIFIYGTGMIAINLRDTLRVTRNELTRFYETKMDNCTISRHDTLNYPSRGTYQVFYTDCNSDFYPIFLATGSKEYFKLNSQISKESNSVDIRLHDGEKIHEFKIRHPDTEDDRVLGAKVSLWFIGIATILILLTPNSRFKKIEES